MTKHKKHTRSSSDESTITQEMSQSIASLVSEQINKLLQPLVTQIQQLLTDYKRLSDEVAQLREDSKLAKEHLTEVILEEVKQREIRKDYIIISGVSEQQGNTAEDRKAADVAVIKEIAKELKCELDFSVAYRVGKQVAGRPRLLRVKCDDDEERATILRCAKNLRDTSVPHFKSVFINPDRTPLERERRKKLLEEVKRRRLAGEQVMLRFGRIVLSENSKTQNFR